MASSLVRKFANRNLLNLVQVLNNNNNCASIYFIKVNSHSTLTKNAHEHNYYAKPQFLHHRKLNIFDYSSIPNKFDFSTNQQCDSKKDIDKVDNKNKDEEKKLSLYQRFKQMYKDYWYVLLPVHLVTSAVWFGSFYYMAKSGVDVVAILESWNVSDRIVNPLRDSSMGYIAVAYACYKISTPARYTVTLGGTTISINYLKKWGYIKPVPSAERLKEMYQEKKENIMETVKETKVTFKKQSHKLKDKKDDFIGDIDKSIKQITEFGDHIKQKDHIVAEFKKQEKK